MNNLDISTMVRRARAANRVYVFWLRQRDITRAALCSDLRDSYMKDAWRLRARELRQHAEWRAEMEHVDRTGFGFQI